MGHWIVVSCRWVHIVTINHMNICTKLCSHNSFPCLSKVIIKSKYKKRHYFNSWKLCSSCLKRSFEPTIFFRIYERQVTSCKLCISANCLFPDLWLQLPDTCPKSALHLLIAWMCLCFLFRQAECSSSPSITWAVCGKQGKMSKRSSETLAWSSVEIT